MLKRLLYVLIALMLMASAAYADSLTVPFAADTDVCEAFASKYPDVTLEIPARGYYSTTEYINAFLTGEFNSDVFTMSTGSFDLPQLFSKGYCIDLSGNNFIQQEVARMPVSIQELLTQDEKIYGIPFICNLSFLSINAEGWAEAGFTKEDVPSSFVDVLDFLDLWIEHLEDDPDNAYTVYGNFDPSLYNQGSYIRWLTEWLIDIQIMQSAYANEPLRFDTPQFKELLARCQFIGKTLYELDPMQNTSNNNGIRAYQYSLFDEGRFMEDLNHVIPMRLTADQPMLINASLNVAMVYAGSKETELATAFLEEIWRCISPEQLVYLMPDIGPIEDEHYDQRITDREARIAELKAQIETASPADQRDLEDTLERYQRNQDDDLAHPERRYLITEEQLELYQSFGDELYFQPPSVFDATTEEGQNVFRMEEQFAMGLMPLEQFVRRLDELARMLESE